MSTPLTARVGSRADLALLLVTAGLAGAAPVVGLSPLLVALVAVAGLACQRLVREPDLAVRCAVVVVLIPAGLLPTMVQSVLGAGSILLAAGAVLLASAPGAVPRPRLPIAVPVMATFWLWGLMTLWWSQDPSLGLDLLRRYALALLLLVLVITRTSSRAAVDGLMGALAVAAWVLVACGLYAMLTGSRTIDDRLAVFDMNPNDLGNVMLLVTAGVLWRALSPSSRTPARTMQAVAFLGIAMLLIAQSGSRGSLLAFVLLLLGFTATRTLRRWGMVATALGIVVLVAAPAVFGTVLDRARHEDPRQLSRVTLWQSGLALIADHPFGVGLGVGPYVMPTYIEMRSTDAHPPHMPAHNPPIEVGTDTGVVGMVLYNGALVLAAGAFVGSVRRWSRWGDPLWLAYGATIGTCSVAFLATWWKSGGESYSYTTFLLLALWLVGTRASRPQSGSAGPAVMVGPRAAS